jgi:hypothetical protein
MAKQTKDKAIKAAKALATKNGGVIDSSVGNYEKHPFFIKKANEAKALLKKVGLPKELSKNH